VSNNKMFVPGAALDGLRLAQEAENKKLRAEIARLRAEIARLRARIDANAIEYDRLLSRCAALEHVRQQAHALLDFEDAGTYDPAGKGWEHLEENLRNALKEAPT